MPRAPNGEAAWPQDESRPTPAPRLSLSGGVDYASAYYFRGYLQANSGLIAQPYLSVFAPRPALDGAIVTPYLSLFNSTDLTGRGPMSGMSDAMLGAVATWRGVTLDSGYAFYTTAPATSSPVHEFGMKASVDALGWLREARPAVGLRPFAGLYAGLYDRPAARDGYVYAETGFEPSFRFEAAGRKVGVGFPVVVGLSADNYYFDRAGRPSPFGYFSSGVSASMAGPSTPRRRGQWFVNASVRYLYLGADNLAALNGGKHGAVESRVGVGFTF